jgi:hypothetical protein
MVPPSDTLVWTIRAEDSHAPIEATSSTFFFERWWCASDGVPRQ